METTYSWTHPAYEKVAPLIETKTGLVFGSRRHADVETAGQSREAALTELSPLEA
jgi:hypothetical protein